MDVRIPASMQDHIHGVAGAAWVDRLPAILHQCCARWGLQPRPPLDDEHVWMKVNYIAAASRDDEQVVLKVMQSPETFRRELRSLQLAGSTSVQLLGADEELQTLLLERLVPGLPLATVEDDDEATRIAARILRGYWQPAPAQHELPTVADQIAKLEHLRRRFDGGAGPIPERWVQRADAMWGELRSSPPTPVILHGDMHHWNILSAGRQPWLAIDPQGLVGDPGYELGSFLTNKASRPGGGPSRVEVYARRVDILAEELCMERERIVTWAMVRAVVYAWIGLDDGDEPGMDANIAVAESFASLL